MVVSGNDSLESFLKSIQVAFSPLGSNFRNVAKNFERCFNGVVKSGNLNLNRAADDINIEQVAAQLNVKNRSRRVVIHVDDWKKGEGLMNIFLGIFREKCGSNDNDNFNFECNRDEKVMSKKGLHAGCRSDNGVKGNGNRLRFDVALSFVINGFVLAFLSPTKAEKMGLHNMINKDSSCCNDSHVRVGVEQRVVGGIKPKGLKVQEGKDLSHECLMGLVVDRLSNFLKFGVVVQDHECEETEYEALAPPVNQFDHFNALTSILDGRKACMNGFFGGLKFTRAGGVPSSLLGGPSVKDVGEDCTSNNSNQEENGANSPEKLTNKLLSTPLSNVDHLRSRLSIMSLPELVELLPQMGRPSKEDHPEKKKKFSIQDFFKYTEAEGKRFFQELERDGDGQVTLEDVEIAMTKRNLPKRYAQEFMQHTRSRLFSNSFGWKELLSLMEQKEPTFLQAYTSLCLSKSGVLQKNEILASLENAGLQENEDNAVAVMRFLNSDNKESISYGHFPNFMHLLPLDQLQEDPRSIHSEKATVPPAVEILADGILKSALAGGISCAFSTFLMHPVDTVKTQVQASTLSFIEILSKLPQIGVQGLYRGSIPAIIGQFSSHGLRTGICEASKIVLINVAPSLPQLQVDSVGAFLGTFLGTIMRIPCEVLKQRLQAGQFNHVGEALVGTWQQDGLKGFFRGTGMTLCRELPFYVAGSGLYAESKKAVQKLLGRELEPWETIAVGALSGGLTAVMTTPFDVIKTRMMTALQGQPTTMSTVALYILRHEGPLGLFRGAVPRFFWVAPLGAINFAGYELIRKAMD